MHNHSHAIVILLCITIFAFALIAYFIPTFVAFFKKKPLKNIFWLNLLAGWTAIGWVAALVWALLPEQSSVSISSSPMQNPNATKPTRTIDM